MEQSVWIPLLSALAGALIGSITSIATISIQAHFQNKRESTKLAMDVAIQHFKSAISAASTQRGRFEIAPLASYVCYNQKLIELALEKNLTPASIKKLTEEMAQIDSVFAIPVPEVPSRKDK